MTVAFLDLKRQSAELADELSEASRRVFASGSFLLGDRVAELEDALAAICATGHCVGVSSGLDALAIALRASGVGPGDEVIVPAFGPVPTIASVIAAGATPVLCDVEPQSLTLDPELLPRCASDRTRAIVPVHLYGQCADMRAVLAFARAHDLVVVEDVAQAIGARYEERPAGSMGDAAALSFYPTKNLGAAGDAGAIVTSDTDLAERARRLRSLGLDTEGRASERAAHSRLDEIQAAILLVKLGRLEGWTARRRQIAFRYFDGLEGANLALPNEVHPRHHVFHLFAVRARHRSEFRSRLAAEGVDTLIHYPFAVHQHPAYADVRRPVALPVSESAASEVVSLPLYPELTSEEVEAVVAGACRAAAASAP